MFSPVNASKEIVEKYLRYLNTSFAFDDPEYDRLFQIEMRDKRKFYKGPYLDVSDSFIRTKDINQLVQENFLSSSFLRLKIHPDRKLYEHQYKAIEKVKDGKNIVVSTGTGSGKTESFLIPILDELCKMNDQNTLEPGVVALLIYPMNALANDQIERLRSILKDYPEITYGSYTGQTEHTTLKALNKYKALNNDQEPLKNELISREMMHETPPNILITNYSMLEFLMLRPDSSVFFIPGYTKNWKYIVLDEAHVYSGSTGIEVSMLLRRLKARLNRFDIQYILTSATLGSENENNKVAEFAEELCQSTFNEVDVIRAQRVNPKPENEVTNNGIEFINELNDLYNKGLETEIVERLNKINVKQSNKLDECLYYFFLHDENYWEIKQELSTPKTVIELARSLNLRTEDIESFVNLASKAELDSTRLFDARYHMFIKAPDCVYITLSPKKRVFLEPQNEYYEDGKAYKVFSAKTCQYCHAIYIEGKIDSRYKKLTQEKNQDNHNWSLFLLKDHYSNSDSDTDEEDKLREFLVCPYCGKIESANDKQAKFCEHPRSEYVSIIKIDSKNSSTLYKCYNCENTNSFGVLRNFYSGQDAITSVISTALYEELPSTKIVMDKVEKKGFNKISETPSILSLSKQFLTFSDSRQAAAKFASYFDDTYEKLLNRRIIIETLKNNEYEYPISFDDFARSYASYMKVYNDKKDISSRVTSIQALMNELFSINSDNGLIKRNLLKVNYKLDTEFDELKLNEKELNHFCMVIAESLMVSGAIFVDPKYSLTQEDYEYFTFSYYLPSINFSASDKKEKIKSFIPTTEKSSNKRFDYIQKIMKAKGIEITTEKVIEIAENIFTGFKDLDLFIQDTKKGTYRINPSRFVIEKDLKFYKCDSCLSYTTHNIENLCPNYKCQGHLHEVDDKEEFKNNHYYRLYTELEPQSLNIVEHTAQLSSEKAYQFQKEFIDKKINVLSCSTTFEMGVDVGSLETVFLRNMPPSPANYAQRAGRAGRSTQSAAFALTFCNRASHDYTYFEDPVAMIKGVIKPPKFNIHNDKIALRHIYATSFSHFWYIYPEYFTNAKDFVENNGVEKFKEYLESEPEDLKKQLLNILPNDLILFFDIENFGWLKILFDENGPLNIAKSEYNYTSEVLNNAYDEITANKGYGYAIQKRLNTLEKEKIIPFLVNHNLLPKYGFPVDTVNLKVANDENINTLGIDLSRDLSLAISEYAPGAQVIAAGQLITSRYINKIPNLGWKTFAESQCGNCGTLNIDQYGTDEDLDSILKDCKACHQPLTNTKNKVIVPTFGFTTDSKIKKAGSRFPDRLPSSEIFYVGERLNIENEKVEIDGVDIQFGYSERDKLAALNYSSFLVCESCGYAEDTIYNHYPTSKRSHFTSTGYKCSNEILKNYNLGYTFETDVLHLRFTYPDIRDHMESISILYGILEGITYTLNIDRQDIGGAVKFQHNNLTRQDNYQFVIFDKTPGGSGYVRQLYNQSTLIDVFRNTLKIMKQCDCGGSSMDTACYSCLMNYDNQYWHSFLKRGYVVNFFERIFNREQYKEELDNSGWFEIKRYIKSNDIKELVSWLEERIEDNPIVGYEFESTEYADAELVWEDAKLALLLPQQKQYESIINKLGYKTILFNRDEMIDIGNQIKEIVDGY